MVASLSHPSEFDRGLPFSAGQPEPHPFKRINKGQSGVVATHIPDFAPDAGDNLGLG